MNSQLAIFSALLLAATHAHGADDGMQELCMTCWTPGTSGTYTTPEGGVGTFQTDPQPPVYDLDMGGRRQRAREEREREERDDDN